MKCTVLFFAQLAEDAECRECVIELKSGACVSDALTMIASNFTLSPTLLSRIAIAVNEKYSPPETILQDGDRIALIPPVSGG